jgi:hypothetical protein
VPAAIALLNLRRKTMLMQERQGVGDELFRAIIHGASISLERRKLEGRRQRFGLFALAALPRRALRTPWPSVSYLLPCISPTTVTGLIVAVIVDAIECHAFRPFAHVGEKRLERAPLCAD